METFIWRGGSALSPEAAATAVSLFDHGYLYGNGLFETMRVSQGKVRFLTQHLERLDLGMAVLRWPQPPSRDALTKLVRQAVAASGKGEAVARLTLSAGAGPLRPDSSQCSSPQVTVFVTDAAARQGSSVWRLSLAAGRRNPYSALTAVKSANYLENLLARQAAREQDADEALFLNVAGTVAEGAVSNLFFLQQDCLITPDLASGLLPGIMRGQVIAAARRQGLPVQERPVELGELAQAQAVFMTNAVFGLVPVVSLAGQPVAQDIIAIDQLRRWVEGGAVDDA